MSLMHFERVMMASLVLAIAFSAPVRAQGGLNTELATDMVLQIQQLQNEVRMLRGQMEDQAHQIETLQRRQRDQYLDLDQRITELRGGAAKGPSNSSITRYHSSTTSESSQYCVALASVTRSRTRGRCLSRPPFAGTQTA